MAVCFGCDGAFEPGELEEVGDALFCRACLAKLLRRADAAVVPGNANAATANGAPGTASAPAVADAPCFVCGEALEGQAFVELRGFAICARCARGLLGDGAPSVEGEGAERAGALPSAPGRSSDPERAPSAPGAGTEWCAGCGRAMPGPGSYRLVEGRPHCPACQAARRPGGGPSGAIAAPPEELCDSCRRPAPELRVTRGFRLCVACLESAPELALALAQARHRRRLERKGRRLVGEGEDD
jgi:hypothetical protein